MEPVAPEFTDQTFRYSQLERQGTIAIYQQQHKASGIIRYEVVRIRIRKARIWPNGVSTPDQEAYPAASAWGQDGWTFYTWQMHMRFYDN
jgi:hypothetical protein